jgi:hypothetical protein
MNFFLVDIATMVAAGLAFVALITARHRYAGPVPSEPHGRPAARYPTRRHEIRPSGNKAPRAPVAPPGVQYVDPSRLVFLR